MKTNTHLSYLAQFFSERQAFQRNIVEKIKTQFMFNNFLSFRKLCRLLDNVEKYCRAEQATDDNTAHAQCMLDT